MKFQKLIKADWSSIEEDWDGVEPYDQRVQIEKNVKEQLEKLNAYFSKLDVDQLPFEKEQEILNKLEELFNSLKITNETINNALNPTSNIGKGLTWK